MNIYEQLMEANRDLITENVQRERNDGLILGIACEHIYLATACNRVILEGEITFLCDGCMALLEKEVDMILIPKSPMLRLDRVKGGE